jgi:hypothetical protein
MTFLYSHLKNLIDIAMHPTISRSIIMVEVITFSVVKLSEVSFKIFIPWVKGKISETL